MKIQGYSRRAGLALIAGLSIMLSAAAHADIPPPEKQIFASGITWGAIGIVIAAAVGIIVFRKWRR